MPELETPPRFSDTEPTPPPQAQAGQQKKTVWGGLATLLLSLLKLGKLGKILMTGSTMFVSAWVYATSYGWPFGIGFVLCILVHEMGHVFVAWRQGLPVSAPVFIPGMGAVIFNKRGSKSAWAQSIMGIGGPVAGAIAAVACWAIYAGTGNGLFLGLAYVGFMINLFNLTPILPLDGGWIVGAVSPWLWLGGLVGILVMALTGFLRNPLVYILIIVSIPTLYTSLKTGRVAYAVDQSQATKEQKIVMGLCYLGLAAFLAFGMAETHAIGR